MTSGWAMLEEVPTPESIKIELQAIPIIGISGIHL